MFIVVAVSLLFAACTPTHFGVPEEEWQAMSEAERVTTIKGYNERQRLREERRLEDEKRRRVIAEAEMRERNEYIDAIYAGRRGQVGDLLRVSLKGGKLRLSGKHREYRPFSFKIADRECKKVEFFNNKKHRSYHGTLEVCYEDGTLLVDVSGRGQDYGAEAFVFDPSWMKGATYQHVQTHGRTELKNVDIAVVATTSAGHVVDHRVW